MLDKGLYLLQFSVSHLRQQESELKKWVLPFAIIGADACSAFFRIRSGTVWAWAIKISEFPTNIWTLNQL